MHHSCLLLNERHSKASNFICLLVGPLHLLSPCFLDSSPFLHRPCLSSSEQVAYWSKHGLVDAEFFMRLSMKFYLNLSLPSSVSILVDLSNNDSFGIKKTLSFTFAAFSEHDLINFALEESLPPFHTQKLMMAASRVVITQPTNCKFGFFLWFSGKPFLRIRSRRSRWMSTTIFLLFFYFSKRSKLVIWMFSIGLGLIMNYCRKAYEASQFLRLHVGANVPSYFDVETLISHKSRHTSAVLWLVAS